MNATLERRRRCSANLVTMAKSGFWFCGRCGRVTSVQIQMVLRGGELQRQESCARCGAGGVAWQAPVPGFH